MSITVFRLADRNPQAAEPQPSTVPLHALGGATRQVLRRENPYVHVGHCPAGSTIAAHSHSETEVMVVLEGSVRIGPELCEAGSIVVIDADETYSLEVSGDHDLVFVIVRQVFGSHSFVESNP